jgi:putative FmdB family regulatory protein
MPTYDYKCTEHGYFELKQSMKDHARGECPTCRSDCKQVLVRAPRVDVEGLADAGCPGALETSGNRMEKRHKKAGQDHHYWRDDVSTKDAVRTQMDLESSSAYE